MKMKSISMYSFGLLNHQCCSLFCHIFLVALFPIDFPIAPSFFPTFSTFPTLPLSFARPSFNFVVAAAANAANAAH